MFMDLEQKTEKVILIASNLCKLSVELANTGNYLFVSLSPHVQFLSFNVYLKGNIDNMRPDYMENSIAWSELDDLKREYRQLIIFLHSKQLITKEYKNKLISEVFR